MNASSMYRRRDTIRDGRRLRWVMFGPLGAVEFTIAALVQPYPDDVADMVPTVVIGGVEFEAFHLGYHTRQPLPDAAGPIADCDLIEGPCYADSDGQSAEELLRAWTAGDQADELIWEWLAEYYMATLGGGR